MVAAELTNAVYLCVGPPVQVQLRRHNQYHAQAGTVQYSFEHVTAYDVAEALLFLGHYALAVVWRRGGHDGELASQRFTTFLGPASMILARSVVNRQVTLES